jgi:hypothetical protein
MSRPESKQPPAADERDALSIPEFCKRHGISPQLYYKFRSEMPISFTVGTRRLISKEAAAAWRRAREAETTTTEQPAA